MMTTITDQDRTELLSIVGRFSAGRMMVLGDLVADEYVVGEITRISREAPVLILKQREKHVAPGGAANAAHNLADLGATVTPVGVVGDDETGDALLRCFRDKGISTRHVTRLKGFGTPAKSRILGGLSHWQRQQIVRIDREPASPPSAEVRRRLTKSAISLAPKSSGMLVSDYGYGATDAAEVEFFRRSTRSVRVPVAVDSRYRLMSYKNVTTATPNEPEVEAAFGVTVGNDVARLHELGRKLLRRQGLEALLVTRGRDGMVLFEPRHEPRHIPIFGSDQAVDVTGAGDTVIAAYTLALGVGASFVQAALIANCAGGLVVMKRGTATVSSAELAEAIEKA
jgi:D-glycero-beta-D-manno-heptose-7-phosphate kinase